MVAHFLVNVVIEPIASWNSIAALLQTLLVRIFWRKIIFVDLVLCAQRMLRVVVVAFVAAISASGILFCYIPLVVFILETQMAATDTFTFFAVHDMCKYFP